VEMRTPGTVAKVHRWFNKHQSRLLAGLELPE